MTLLLLSTTMSVDVRWKLENTLWDKRTIVVLMGLWVMSPFTTKHTWETSTTYFSRSLKLNWRCHFQCDVLSMSKRCAEKRLGQSLGTKEISNMGCSGYNRIQQSLEEYHLTVSSLFFRSPVRWLCPPSTRAPLHVRASVWGMMKWECFRSGAWVGRERNAAPNDSTFPRPWKQEVPQAG